MRSMESYRLLLLVGILSVSFFSLNTFAMLPTVLVSNQSQLLQSALATFPGENGKIAFTRITTDSNYDIYMMNSDGSGQTNIINNALLERSPVWSPDGTKIAFSAFEYIGGVYTDDDIYVMNADGSGVTRLTDHPSSDFAPDWSPDGTKIIFTSERENTAFSGNEIYVINADGSGR